MNPSSWCLCLLQQPDLSLLGISWQSWAVPSRSCWSGCVSLLCYTSCTVTHTLWVGLMDAFFSASSSSLWSLVASPKLCSNQGGTVPGSAAWLGAFPACLYFSRLRLSSSCWPSSSWAFPEVCEHLNCVFAGIQQTPALCWS